MKKNWLETIGTGTIVGVIGRPVLIIIILPMAIYHAWVSSILWSWFIAPTFGLPVLSVAQMWGASVTIGIIRMKPYRKSVEDEGVKPLFYFFFGPLLALAAGYVVKFWVM